MPKNTPARGATKIARDLGARTSPDLDRYATGRTSGPQCVLCGPRACACKPPSGG